MIEDVMGELWLVVAAVIIYVGKLIIDKKKNGDKCTDGKHCIDHTQVVKDIGKIKVDTEVTKTNVGWIREKLEGK